MVAKIGSKSFSPQLCSDVSKKNKKSKPQEKLNSVDTYQAEDGTRITVLAQNALKPSNESQWLSGDVHVEYLNKNQYDGSVNDGFFHGHGKYSVFNDSTFNGIWKKGIFQSGVWMLPDGETRTWKKEGNKKGTIIFDNGDKFQGTFENGLANGNGRLTLKDGSVIDGTWKDGQFQPGLQGKKTYRDKNYYWGVLNKHMQPVGNGELHCVSDKKTIFASWDQGTMDFSNVKIHFENGDVYTGSINPNLRAEGDGELVRQDGTKIVDKDWKDGKARYPEITFPSGEFYKGEVNKNYQPNGSGIYHTDDRVITGLWKNGKPTKDALFTVKYIATGEGFAGFLNENGQPDGTGKMKRSDGMEIHGQFVDGKLSSIQKVIKNDITYEGEFDASEKLVKGTITYHDGTVYDGPVKDWKPEGKGKWIIMHTNGDKETIIGFWKDGEFQQCKGLIKKDLFMPNSVDRNQGVYVKEFKYEGGLNKSMKKDGEGELLYDNYTVTGEWHNGDLTEGEITADITKASVTYTLNYKGPLNSQTLLPHGMGHAEFNPHDKKKETVVVDAEWVNGRLAKDPPSEFAGFRFQRTVDLKLKDFSENFSL